MAAILLGDKRLSDLKVTELKAELDKRGLSKKGVKSVLVERLKKAILQEELSNVNDEDDDADSGQEISADTSQDGGDSGGAEAAVPTGDAVGVGPDGSSVDADPDPDPSVSADPPPPQVTSDGDTAVEAPVVESTAEENKPPSAPVCDRPNDETETERAPSAPEIDTVAMDTSDSVAASDDGQGEEEKGQSNQPMDLGSPLDSDPEFDLLPGEQDDSMDMPGKEGDGDDRNEEVAKTENQEPEEAAVDDGDKEEEKGEEGVREEEETEEKKESEKEEAKGAGEKRIDRLDSTFDSSYEPATEELLYEGDPDTEVKQETSEEKTPAEEGERATSQEKDEWDKLADTSATTERRDEDEGFMVEVHYKDQGGGLEDPAASVIGPAPSSSSVREESRGKASVVTGGKTTGNSNRLSGCHLWVAGLVASVRALDLQTLFSSFGQVVSAKVVAKAQSKARFGYVTLATREQAQKCILELNGTELKGSTIHVELAKTAPPLSQPSPRGGKTQLSHRASATGSSRGKDNGAKNGHDAREKDKVGQAITRKSPGGGGGGEGRAGVKAGDRGREDRRRSSGSSRYHGDERSSHSRRSRSPPLRRSPRGGRHRGGRMSPSPRSSGSYPGSSSLRGPASHSRDARDDIIRREEQRRDLMERRLGADPYYRDGSRQVMVDDRRFTDRYQEIAARRQLELEQTRREQEMARRMQEIRERETREREIRERQLAEQERVFKERERVMREREYRERQRREHLEKELRERDQREKELRERERRMREQHMQEIRDRELKVARERELREREVQARVQRERELQEKEQRLLQEHQRIQKEKQMYEEQQRRLREEAERQAREREVREREAREARERDRKLEAERERRLREEKERERERRERERAAEEKRLQLERAAKLEHEREQKRKQEEMKWEREQSRMLQQQRLGKRGSGGYQDSAGYDMAKRQAVHDIRSVGGGVRGASTGGGGGGMDIFDLSSSVFSRLDPQKQVTADGRVSGGGMQNVSGMISGSRGGGKNSSMADTYSRRSAGDTGGVGGGGYRQGGGYGVGGGMGRERHMDTGVTYPIPSLNKSGGPTSSQGYQKTSGTIGGGVTVVQKGGAVGLSRQNQDIISAALANIQKSVSTSSSIANQMHIQGSSPIQQMSSAAHMSATGLGDYMNRGDPVGGQVSAIGGVARQMMSGGGGMGGMAKPPSKLPPEDERYNRRFTRPSHAPRQGNIKRF